MDSRKTNYKVLIPNWESSFKISESVRPKYWLWKDRDKLPKKYADIIDRHPKIIKTKAYCASPNGDLFVKNTKKVGHARYWVINGQQLYSGTLHPLVRSKITKYFHTYFTHYINQQLPRIVNIEGPLSISCDIYEIKRSHIPDIDNLWPLIKWFQDALQETGKIIDDCPDVIIESGRKRYHWVEDEKDRKLIFNIEKL